MAVENLSAPFAMVRDVREAARLYVGAARTAVVSWNTRAVAGTLQFRLLRAHQPSGSWFNYARWHGSGRHSFSAQSDGEGVRVDVDVIEAQQPFDGIEVRAGDVDFALAAVATPVRQTPSHRHAGNELVLDVPLRSQYVVEGQRAWCSAASLAMLNAYHGVDIGVAETAAGVIDGAYNGTGNWAFNAAFSGSLGLRAVVAYLRNFDHAARLVAQNVPIALSYSWRAGELPGAPIEHSDGHLAVLCGFTAAGDAVVNDPAAAGVRVVYARAALEQLWLRSGGVCYAVAPRESDPFDILAAP